MNQTIERLSLKNLIAFGVATAMVTALLAFVMIIPYYEDTKNTFFAPFEFDLERAVEEHPLVSFSELRGQPTVSDIESQELLLYTTKYMQSGRYIFRLEPDRIGESGVVYEAALRDGWARFNMGATHQYMPALVSDVQIFVRALPNTEFSDGDALRGVFLPFPQYLISDLRNGLSADTLALMDNVFPYVFDTTRDFVFERTLAVGAMILSLAIILLMIFKLISQIKDKNKRPLYKKISLLNGDVAVVDEQFANAFREGKDYVLPDWIITPALFRTHITRNLRNLGDI